jgi:hypothetical protein
MTTECCHLLDQPAFSPGSSTGYDVQHGIFSIFIPLLKGKEGPGCLLPVGSLFGLYLNNEDEGDMFL